MGRMFDPQNSFWRFFGLVPDVLILSLMWVLFSLPVVTIGASTTALYDAVAHGIRFKEGGCISVSGAPLKGSCLLPRGVGFCGR